MSTKIDLNEIDLNEIERKSLYVLSIGAVLMAMGFIRLIWFLHTYPKSAEELNSGKE